MPKVKKAPDQGGLAGSFLLTTKCRLRPKISLLRQTCFLAARLRRWFSKLIREELTKAVARATDVFGREDAAFRWLGTPVAALDYATPISCLGTHRGVMRVNDVLTQIEHGVW